MLEAFVSVNPGGFNPASKLGKSLAAIHTPVPKYGEKMETSMDRFFKRLEIGKYVKRYKWTINTNKELFQSGAETNHAGEGEKVEELKLIGPEQVCAALAGCPSTILLEKMRFLVHSSGFPCC